ncbi:hypothetical protein PS687_04464 [Pseudomonas fluorescens]|nr:hypothetical protein PS687_04464 [Pseudomonas fluorescens]
MVILSKKTGQSKAGFFIAELTIWDANLYIEMFQDLGL